jgi:hypothetical protein
MMTFAAIADALLADLGLTPVRCATEDEARARAAARRPGDREWPVYYFTSDTSGEKPFEEFHTADEVVDLDRFAALGVVRATTDYDIDGIRALAGDLRALFEREELTKEQIVAELARLVPTFDHVETGTGLDQKM